MVKVGIDDGGVRLSLKDIELAPSLDNLTKIAAKNSEVASNLAPALSSLKQAKKMASALLVTSGATVECSQMRDKKEVKLKGSGSGIKVGSVEALTVLDTTFKPKDFGICKELTAKAVKKWEKAGKKGKRPEIKCVPDLPLYMWEDADSSTVISSSPALHKLCTLKCSHKGTIKIVKTGQGSKNDELLEGIDPSVLGGYLVLAGLGVYSEGWQDKISENSILKDIFGKLFGYKNVTTDPSLTFDNGGAYQKVTRTEKDKGIFNANYKNGKFSGFSIEFLGISIDANDWDLSVGANVKLFGTGVGVNLGLTKDGLDSSVSYSNGKNSYNYGLKDQWDLANGLLAAYVKNKTVLVNEKDFESSVTVEKGDRFFNGGQAVKVGVIAGAGALFVAGVVSGRGDITEKAKELFQEGVGKLVESGA